MEAPKVVVLDASVVVKWFNVEEYTDVALEARKLYESGALEVAAPELLMFEVGNALRYNPSFGIEDVKRALRALEDMQLDLRPLRGELAEEAVRAAFAYGLTLYDAAYVALAAQLGAPYYTADREVVEKVSAGYVKHVAEFRT